MIAALLCATLIAQNQDAPRITVEQRALRADVALRKIGEKFGVNLAPDESTKNDVLLVYLQDVSFEEFRRKTAKGWNAAWKQEDNGWVLLRTPEQEQAEMQKFLTLRKQELERGMALWGDLRELTQHDADKIAEYIGRSDEYRFRFKDLPTLEVGTIRPDTLGRRALRRFLRRLGAESLAEQFNGQRVYESGLGTHYHPALEDVLRLYERENGSIRSAFRKIGQLDSLVNLVSEYGPVNVPLDSLDVTKGVSKFVIKLSADLMSFWPVLYAFDHEGSLLFSVKYDFLFSRRRSMSLLPLDRPLDLTVSDRAAGILDYFERRSSTYGFDDDEREPLPLRGSVLLDVLKAMPEDDMLSYEPSESLLALSKSLGLGLVARLSDELQGGSISDARGDVEDADPRERTLKKSPGMFAVDYLVRVESGDKMIVIEPKTPATLRPLFPRKAITEFSKRADSPIGADVYDLGRLFAAARDYDSVAQIDFLSDAVPEYQWASGERNFGFYHFILLAWLGPAQQQTARTASGVTVSLGQLPDIVRQILNLGLTFTDFTYQMMDYDSWEALGISGEKRIEYLLALALPDGAPPYSAVNVKLTDKVYVYIKDPDEPKVSLGLSSAASHYRWIDDEDETTPDQWLATVPFYIGSAVDIELKVDMGVALLTESGEIVTSRGGGRRYTFSELPADVQEEFWELVEKWSQPIGLEAPRGPEGNRFARLQP